MCIEGFAKLRFVLDGEAFFEGLGFVIVECFDVDAGNEAKQRCTKAVDI